MELFSIRVGWGGGIMDLGDDGRRDAMEGCVWH